jgi:hypothetical protein
MKRFLLILTFVFVCGVNVYAQKTNACVTLKNGTALSGVVLEIDPASYVRMIVAGVVTTIKMQDVQSIEETDASIPVRKAPEPSDEENLPETYMLQVGPYEIEMALVRGATFTMGFDGHGSLAMNSEPVHDVTLSSFYVNVKPLEKAIVDYLNGKETNARTPYRPLFSEDVFAVTSKLACKCGLPIDVITEAQWEYVATSENKIKFMTRERNCCRDYFDEYRYTSSPQLDPVGPRKGADHVIRSFAGKGNDIYHRYSTGIDNSPSIVFTLPAVRFTFHASALLKEGE